MTETTVDGLLANLKLYFDDHTLQNAVRGKFRHLAALFEEVEKPFRKPGHVSQKTAAGETVTIPTTFLPKPITPTEAFNLLKELRARQAFELFKEAFASFYTDADFTNKSVIVDEIKNIELFIYFSSTYPAQQAFATKPSHAINSNRGYQCVDASPSAEYYRLMNGFYTSHLASGDMYSLPARVYALCEYFLPYLKSKVAQDSYSSYQLGRGKKQLAENPTQLKLKQSLREFGFFDLNKVKVLKPDKVDKLLTSLLESDTPYRVAMLEYLGFPGHLYKHYFTNKNEIYKAIGGIFGIGVRSVKGNLLVLTPGSGENIHRYTAHQYVEIVENDYQQLK